MSCHVAIIVSTVIKIFSKLFYQLKISLNILRESLLALLQLKNCHSPTADSGNEDLKKPEVIYFMWIATLTLAMTGKVKVAMTNAMTKKILSLRGFVKTEVIHKKEILLILDCFVSRCVPHSVCFSNGNARNDRYEKQNRIRCAPHGDDDNKNFQFDKFQRLFSVIYKKNSLTKEISK